MRLEASVCVLGYYVLRIETCIYRRRTSEDATLFNNHQADPFHRGLRSIDNGRVTIFHVPVSYSHVCTGPLALSCNI